MKFRISLTRSTNEKKDQKNFFNKTDLYTVSPQSEISDPDETKYSLAHSLLFSICRTIKEDHKT